MRHRLGFPFIWRSVVRSCLVVTLCLTVLLALWSTPGVKARQNLDQTRNFVFHGHQVSVALASDAANSNSLKGGSGLAGLVPIPGGLTLPPPFPPLIHVFFPGPINQGDQGIDTDPTVIFNVRGFAALAYPVGTATDSQGNAYDMGNDMRLFQGEYVSVDGTHHRGTFVFI